MTKAVRLTLLVLMLALFACTAKNRRPKCFVFPAGYVGWVTVEYRVAEAGALPIRDGCVWLDFTKSQFLKTKSEIEEGWAADRYLEYDGSKTKPLTSDDTGRSVQEHLFQFTGLNRTPDSSRESLFLGTPERRRATPRQ